MFRYAFTILVSAFLLFQVQPLTARYILPWFGGSPAVWTTCMLFFQLLLLGGYTYAHVSSRYWPTRQPVVHGLLLLLALACLPIIPSEFWKPTGVEAPVTRILLLLTATIGLPYFLLSTTGPLVQYWFSQAHPHRSPYRLFALSNAGSLLALLTYPALFEPNLQLQTQAWLWSSGFAVFVVGCLSCAWQQRALTRRQALEAEASAQDAVEVQAEPEPAERPSGAELLTWLGLSMFPSILLLATTNQMCQEVAVVPFLWILPLSLYLISFVICFDKEKWYSRSVFGLLLWLSVALAAVCLYAGVSVPLQFQVVGYSLALFAACMTCHGELSRHKPAPRYLTHFYLAVSAGGALGGLFVVLVATHLFQHYWELHLGLVGCVLMTLVAYWRSDRTLETRRIPGWLWPFLATAATVTIIAFAYQPFSRKERVVERGRDFYGVLTVTQGHDSHGDYLSVKNGRIQHGFQYLDDDKQMWKTSYYTRGSGVGLAIELHPRRQLDPDAPLKIGVIGLGTGTLATYGRDGDTVQFYEINPEVLRVARERFTYLQRSPADVSVILGDARIKLEQELAEGGPQRFDVLAVDAFSSDAIPMHLLTRECCRLYWEHLEPKHGILAFHISNRYLDLEPVMLALAQQLGVEPLLIDFDAPRDDPAQNNSTWVLLTRSSMFTSNPLVAESASSWPDEMTPILWTDDFGSLRQVLRTPDLKQSVWDLVDWIRNWWQRQTA